MLKRIIASASLLLYLLLPFFNIQIMNIFYPNFLRANHTALFGITILFILNIVLTILVITLSIKTLSFYWITPSCFDYWYSKNFTNLCFYPIDYIPFVFCFCFWGSYFLNCFIKILNSIYIKI